MRQCFKYIAFFLTVCFLLAGCSPNGELFADSDTDAVTEESDRGDEGQSDTESERESESESEYEDEEEEEEEKMDPWHYRYEDGLMVREFVIDTGKGGDPIEIIQLTDIHINYCNEEDLKDPVLKSTYENRTWLKNFAVKKNLQRCLAYAEGADQLVITGDIYDYLSEGAIEMAQEYIFGPNPDVLACLGNHEPLKKMQGTVEETTAHEERMQILEQTWCHDVYYQSRVLGEKVMLIVMDNASGGGIGAFHDSQVPLLEADLALARENGYAVLLFFHIPISTGNPNDREVYTSYRGDAQKRDFYDQCIRNSSEGASGEIYRMIVNNSDIIKGVFNGHHHSDFYTEIWGAGENAGVIPQYTICGVPYGNGHIMKITVK